MEIEHSNDSDGGGHESGRVINRLARVSRVAAVTCALLLLGVTAAACSGGSTPSVASAGRTATTGSSNGQPSSGGASSNGATGGGQAIAIAGGNGTAALAFSQCMRAHGVADFPDPSANGQIDISGGSNSDLNPNNPTFQKAQNACQSKLPKPSPAQQAQALKSALKMAECMRAHGITDFPDPQSGHGGRISISINGSSGSDLNPNNPAFQAAQKVCMPNAPIPSKQGSSGSGTKSGSGAVFSTGGAG